MTPIATAIVRRATCPTDRQAASSVTAIIAVTAKAIGKGCSTEPRQRGAGDLAALVLLAPPVFFTYVFAQFSISATVCNTDSREA